MRLRTTLLVALILGIIVAPTVVLGQSTVDDTESQAQENVTYRPSIRLDNRIIVIGIIVAVVVLMVGNTPPAKVQGDRIKYVLKWAGGKK